VQTLFDDLVGRPYAVFAERLFLVVHAIGVQKYTCQANGTWLFTDPEATLYKTTGVAKPIGTHFLNFATGRPVWQLKDGSSVEAARTQTVPGAAGNIPWLLLQAVLTTAGSDGDRLANTTWFSGLTPPAGSLRPERARPTIRSPCPTAPTTSSGERPAGTAPATDG
jgi:uncharacterized protein DUF3455